MPHSSGEWDTNNVKRRGFLKIFIPLFIVLLRMFNIWGKRRNKKISSITEGKHLAG